MRTLYPEIEPFRIGRLQVSDLHTLYFEECGNPDGKPVVFLHGGPGGGISPDMRRFFNPEAYHGVLFDQRGAGKSTPYAEITDNNTWALVEDLEKLRKHLAIERWVVFGGSWGTTLALCYAISHPDRVIGLVLRGVYLGRAWENRWLFQEGASYFYPEYFQKYIAPIPPAERGDLMAAYYKRLNDPDPAIHLPAAVAWSGWENCLVHHLPVPETPSANPLSKLAIARFENFYNVNQMFFPSDNYILEHASLIAHLPCRIIHGRYDVVCPAVNAWDLHQAMPLSQLNYIPDGGHAASDPGMTDAIIQALDEFVA